MPKPVTTTRTLTDDDAPQGIRANKERLDAWHREQAERYRVVATCKCGRKMSREDIPGHPLKHASNGKVRSVAGSLLLLTPEEIGEVIALVKDMPRAT